MSAVAERPAIGWSPEWTATGRCARVQRIVLDLTRPCPTCWEQGRTWCPARNGEGLVPVICERCAGTGRVAREVGL